MSLMRRWAPVRDLFDIHKEMNKLFDTMLGKYDESTDLSRVWSPALDLTEDKDNIYVKAEIPGMNKDDIKLEFRDNTLVLSGYKKCEYEDKKEDPHRIEISYGEFKRVIPLPDSIELKKIEATYQDGILKVTLPKSEKAKPKQIEIKIK